MTEKLASRRSNKATTINSSEIRQQPCRARPVASPLL